MDKTSVMEVTTLNGKLILRMNREFMPKASALYCDKILQDLNFSGDAKKAVDALRERCKL